MKTFQHTLLPLLVAFVAAQDPSVSPPSPAAVVAGPRPIALSVEETYRPTVREKAPTILVPSTGPCTERTCARALTWDYVATFVETAASGDALCLCGRLYENDFCGAPAKLHTAKDITIECAPGQICTYACPHAAFVVDNGSLSLMGTAHNFRFTGGQAYSRVLVNDGAFFSASQIVFEETASVVPAISTFNGRRRLQQPTGRGGAIDTHGVTTVEDCKFTQCRAGVKGGAIYVGGGSASFSSSSFTGNYAVEGGAIFVERGILVLEDSVFTDNQATNTLNDGDDIFTKSMAFVDACNNVGESEILNSCQRSGAATVAGAWISLAAGAIATFFL